MENMLLEKANIKAIIGPVDLNTAANTGLRMDMAKYRRVTFLVILDTGTTTTTHSFALKQHTVASSGTPAALSVDNPYYHKVNTATAFTKVQPTVAADTYDLHSLLASTKGIVAFEVLAEQLTNGYRWASIDVADTGGAQLGTVIAIGHEADDKPAYAQDV